MPCGRDVALVALLSLVGCAGDPTPIDTGAGSGSSGTSNGSTNGTSGLPTAPTTTRAAETGDSQTGPMGATSTGRGSTDDTASGSDSSSGSTGTPVRCPDGVELVALGSACVSAPIVVSPEPAYDVTFDDGVVVATDAGVTQYRSVGGELVAVSTLALPSRGQDLHRGYFVSEGPTKEEVDERTRVMVTLPDSNALALLNPDEDGLIVSATLLDTGPQPMGVSYVPVPNGEGIGVATANAGDGTLSIFSQQGHAGLAPTTTLNVGGSPRAVSAVEENIGVIDTDASTLTVITLTGAEFTVLGTYATPESPVLVRGMFGSDTGPRVFLVMSRDADRVTMIRASDGTEWSHADHVGGPSDIRLAGPSFWAPGVGGGFFAVGVIAMTDTSRIALAMHSHGRNGLQLDRMLGDFPTAAGPVAVALADANGDTNFDFVSASPTSGLAVVLQQP